MSYFTVEIHLPGHIIDSRQFAADAFEAMEFAADDIGETGEQIVARGGYVVARKATA